jgi:hypothetical protein
MEEARKQVANQRTEMENHHKQMELGGKSQKEKNNATLKLETKHNTAYAELKQKHHDEYHTGHHDEHSKQSNKSKHSKHKGQGQLGGSIYTSEPFYHHHRKYIRGGGAPDVDKIKRTIETTVKEEIKEEFEDRFSPSMQSEKASDEKLDPKIIGLLNKYLKSYYTNVVASSGLYTAWVITIICIVSMDEMFGHQYR